MSDAPDRDLLAAEYVLGTLEGDEAAEAVRLLATDATFAAAVRDWEERLTPLAAALPAVAPSPQLWDRIEATTAPSTARSPAAPSPTATATVVSSTTATATTATASTAPSTADPLRTARSTTARSTAEPSTAEPSTTAPSIVVPFALRRSLRIWQASTGAALALAASLAAFVVVHSPPPPRVAVLAPTAGGVSVLLATVEPNGVLRIRPDGTIVVPSDHDLELWALGAGETRPRSLGVLRASGMRMVAALPQGTQLMVSLEPRGGSPTGQPTGPVLYGGRLTAEE